MKKKKNSFIVPLVFSLSDYEKDSPLYLWIFELYTNYASRNNSAIISQEFYFNYDINVLEDNYWGGIKNDLAQKKLNDVKRKYLKYSISNKKTRRLLKNKESLLEVETDLLINKNKHFISMIEESINMIEKDYNQKIDALMVWVSNPSLEELAKKRKIKIISQELSPIRNTPNNSNYNTTLCYFQFKNKYDKEYAKKLFYDFKKTIKKENLQIFSRDELLSMFLNTDDLCYLNELKNPSQYELGLSPGFENDPFFKAYSNEEIEETCKKINDLFPPTKVSIRYHPNLESSIGNTLWEKDTSIKSIYWILKCRRIVTSVSNIGFDAMMFGKTCYTLTENMPFAFKSINQLDWRDESIVDSLYLNFMIFGIFTHWDLILDQDYIDWRMSDPDIFEIFKYNRKYILKSLDLDTSEKRLTQKDILHQVHKIDEKNIEQIVGYNLFDRIESIEDKNNKLRNESDNLKNENDNLKNENDNLKNENDNLKNENDNLKNENDNLKNENDNLKNENDNLKNENDNLRKTIKSKVKEIQDIYISKSWKITQPIRDFAKMIRDFKTTISKEDAKQKKS